VHDVRPAHVMDRCRRQPGLDQLDAAAPHHHVVVRRGDRHRPTEVMGDADTHAEHSAATRSPPASGARPAWMARRVLRLVASSSGALPPSPGPGGEGVEDGEHLGGAPELVALPVGELVDDAGGRAVARSDVGTLGASRLGLRRRRRRFDRNTRRQGSS
jgi:hypothetical protein